MLAKAEAAIRAAGDLAREAQSLLRRLQSAETTIACQERDLTNERRKQVELAREVGSLKRDIEARNDAIRSLNQQLHEEYDRSARSFAHCWSPRADLRVTDSMTIGRMTLMPKQYAWQFAVPGDELRHYSDERIAYLAGKAADEFTALIKADITKLYEDGRAGLAKQGSHFDVI